MNYFGGGGVAGALHPSLKAYIDSFMASPMPKMYPRGGGPWDQDPILMRDFRLIRDQEVKFKNAEQELDEAKSSSPSLGGTQQKGGSIGGLGEALNEYLEEEGEDPYF